MKFEIRKLLFGSFVIPMLAAQVASAQWTDGGSNVYLTTSSDNVGIGTNTPGGKVHISSSLTPDPHLAITQTNTFDWARFRMDAGGDAFSLSVGGPNTNTPNTFNIFVSGVGNLFSVKSNGSIGVNNATPVARFQVTDGSVLFNGTTGSTPVSGAGTRMMWVPAKSAFRAGRVTGTQWDDANIGSYSVAMGDDASASGSYGIALGLGATASGGTAAAIGPHTVASGSTSFAIGNRVSAEAAYSTTIGSFNVIPSGVSTFSWVDTDPLFVVANGLGTGSRSNALTMLKNGKTGLGTTAPKNVLDVNGGAVIGTYAGVNTAPTNGLLVSGDVAIGATSSSGYKLYVNGNSYFNGSGTYTGSWSFSDMRLKKDVATISGALSKVMGLRGVTYTYAKENHPEMNFPEGTQIGFIAQEVESVTPEAVTTAENGFKAVGYQNLTAVLVEAMKEQQSMIDVQQKSISTLESENAALKARLEKIEAHLGQNSGRVNQMDMK